MKSKTKFTAGDRIGRLTLIEKEDYTRWRARCDCGATFVVSSQNLGVGVFHACKTCVTLEKQRRTMQHRMVENTLHIETPRRRPFEWLGNLQESIAAISAESKP